MSAVTAAEVTGSRMAASPPLFGEAAEFVFCFLMILSALSASAESSDSGGGGSCMCGWLG